MLSRRLEGLNLADDTATRPIAARNRDALNDWRDRLARRRAAVVKIIATRPDVGLFHHLTQRIRQWHTTPRKGLQVDRATL